MGKAIMFAAVSLDGFIAEDDDTVGPLFDWYENGDVAVTFSDEARVFHTTQETADFLRSTAPNMAAGVLGRRLFDITNGWNGIPPNGEHAFVVTHEPPADWAYRDTAPFTFVTDGVRSAIEQAKAYAGDRDVSVTAGRRRRAGAPRGPDRPGRAQPRARRPRDGQAVLRHGRDGRAGPLRGSPDRAGPPGHPPGLRRPALSPRQPQNSRNPTRRPPSSLSVDMSTT